MKRLLFFILPYFLLSCGGAFTSKEKSNKLRILATINIKHEGCFGGGSSKLQVLEQNGQRTVCFTNDSNVVYKKILDSNSSSTLNEFVKELKEKDFDEGCTLVDYYTVSIGNENFKKTDASCSWSGFSNLLQSLYPAIDSIPSQ